VSRLLDHVAAVAPAGHLAVMAVRYLTKQGRAPRRITWLTPEHLEQVPGWWERQQQGAQFVDDWRWIHDVIGGVGRYLGGDFARVELPGVPMVRLVTAARRPPAAGKLEELATALGVMVDLDISERRPGDRRRYCPTILDGLEFLYGFKPSVIIDAGGGLVAAWLFVEPADPAAARDLAADVIADIGRLAQAEHWAFDSPAFGGQWLKVPGCHDFFRRADVVELSGGPLWDFATLRSSVPRQPRRAARPFIYVDGQRVHG
jgi:hypothetical protein